MEVDPICRPAASRRGKPALVEVPSFADDCFDDKRILIGNHVRKFLKVLESLKMWRGLRV